MLGIFLYYYKFCSVFFDVLYVVRIIYILIIYIIRIKLGLNLLGFIFGILCRYRGCIEIVFYKF